MSIFCSVIIGTAGRAEALRRCLEAFCLQDYPREAWELIIANDGGAPLDALLAEFTDRLPLRSLRLESNQGISAVFNAAAQIAQGTLLIFSGDDGWPAPDWIRQLAKAHQAAPGDLLGSAIYNGLPHNLYAQASQTILDAAYAYYNRAAGQARVFAGMGHAMPAKRFATIGGYDLKLRRSQDRDLCERWREQGWGLTYVPEARIAHVHPLTLAGFWRRHVKEGRGAYWFHQGRRKRGTGHLRQETGYIRDPRNWLFYPLRHERGGRALALMGLLLLWQVANLLGYLDQAWRERAERGDA